MGKNGWYFCQKIVRFFALLLAGAALAFFLTAVSPLDPLQANLGQTALGALSPEQVEKLEAYWGVDTPPVERFLTWLGGVFQGDLGISLLYRQPVTAVIGDKLFQSLPVLVLAWLLSGGIGFILGVAAGVRPRRFVDRVLRGYALLMGATPSFWLALLLLIVFGVWLGWFPIALAVPIGVEADAVVWGERILHGVLPAITLSMVGMPSVLLHTRDKTIQVMESDPVRYAQARGETGWGLIRRHVLRQTLLPALSLQGASVGEILGSSILVEQVFSYPGLGQAAITAALGADVPLLLGITLLTTGFVFLGNLGAELLYAVVDPRIRRRRVASSPAGDRRRIG